MMYFLDALLTRIKLTTEIEISKRDEEYLEAMYILFLKKKSIRVKDLAKLLGVKPSSVVNYLKKLRNLGLISYEKYDVIALSPEGEEIAKRIYRRHEIIKRFLTDILGVPEDIAEEDACYIEHGIHEETFKKIEEFTRKRIKNSKVKD